MPSFTTLAFGICIGILTVTWGIERRGEVVDGENLDESVSVVTSQNMSLCQVFPKMEQISAQSLKIQGEVYNHTSVFVRTCSGWLHF